MSGQTEAREELPGRRRLIRAAVVVFLCWVGVAGAVTVEEARFARSEAAAIAALSSLAVQQLPPPGPGSVRYGTLAELADAKLIDPSLADGISEGYVFQVRVSQTQPEFEWAATANPIVPGESGDRSFVTNHTGVVYFTTGWVLPQPDCGLPPGAIPLDGK